MSTERIKYETSPIGPRIIALVVDLVIVLILAIIFTFLGQIDWFFLQQLLSLDVEYIEVIPMVFVFMVIFSILVYFILVPSFTNGQTIGKLILGLHVVYDDNSNTKMKFVTHAKRLFFMRGGTKVVKVVDERPEGL
ncbi:MAG: RDD family protein [Promethearchaeota archaeon]